MLALLLHAGCAPPFQTPHERYARSLRRAGLDRTASGRGWLAAADRAVADPVAVALPLQESITVPEAEVWARGYRFELRRGQRLGVRVSLPSDDSTRVFADLYQPWVDTTRSPRRLDSANSSPPSVDYEARDDGRVVLRIQTELVRAPRLGIEVTVGPSLEFPVQQRDGRSVLSGFGDARDGGRRSHQGIDIAAPRGTPAVSAARGIVTSAGTNRLGGNVVWVLDLDRNLVLYYAHLDRHGVRTGERVATGDTIGFVGTTGNAEGTVPHLHFGIYAPGEGAIDPYPYVASSRRSAQRRR